MGKGEAVAVAVASFILGGIVMAWFLASTSPVFKRGHEAYGMECVARNIRTGRCLAFQTILPQTEKGS